MRCLRPPVTNVTARRPAMHLVLRPFLRRIFGLVMLALTGCSQPTAETTIRVWSHQGQESENRALRAIADRFNAAHADRGWRVELNFFPDYQYTEKIAIAAAAHDLPDAFDIDGPLLARYVDARLLAPLDPWFTAGERADFLPTIIAQGTIGGKLYALGAFDSATVLYFDRERLARAGVTPPADGGSWTWAEFLAAAATLKTHGDAPLSMHFNEAADEWYTYAFSPVIWSGGGALISSDGTTVRGILASAANVRSLQQWQQVFTRGFAGTDPVDPDPFGSGTVAMDWSGHWMARSHLAKKGARLGVMPLPRIGGKGAAPCGSWCWGISARARDPAAAAAWVRWVTDAHEGIVPIVEANGAVPARRSAMAAFPEYATPPYRVFREQLEQSARPRPHTPHYATLSREFAAALRDIARGADVLQRLQRAEDDVQRVIDRRRQQPSLSSANGGPPR